MAAPKFQNLRTNIAADFSAALVISFLTIAAGSAFGLLTGVGAQAGILSMVIVSLVAWVFGGAPVKVSGPTAPTSAALLAALATVSQFGGGIEAAFGAMIIASFILFAIAFVPLQRFTDWIPNAATAVFVNGISLIIIARQFENIAGYWQLGGFSRWSEIGIVVVTFLILTFWNKAAKHLTRFAWARLLSGSLIAMVTAAIAASVLNLPVATLAVIDINFAGIIDFARLSFTSVSPLVLGYTAVKLAVTIAFVTLVTARALGAKENYNAEVRNIALGNLSTGLIGGIPATIGYTRTKILERAGGQTEAAGIFSAIIVLAIILLVPSLLATIPSAVFTGILLRAAWVSFDWQFLAVRENPNRENIALAIIVVLGSFAMLLIDPLLVVAATIIIWQLVDRVIARGHRMDLPQCPVANLEHEEQQ